MRTFEKLKPGREAPEILGSSGREAPFFPDRLLFSGVKLSKMVGAKRPKIWGILKPGFPENKTWKQDLRKFSKNKTLRLRSCWPNLNGGF